MQSKLGSGNLQTTLQVALLLAPLLGFSFDRVAQAQESATTAGAATAPDALDPPAMAAELARLDAVCQRLQLERERLVMQRWLSAAPGDARRLYLPVEADPPLAALPQADAADKPAHTSWLKHFTAARQRHARYWIAEAQRALAENDEWDAYLDLWRAAREDPDNADAKRALGPLLPALSIRTRPRAWRVADPKLGWPAGSFSRLDTANFQIISRADANTTTAIARRLEQFYALWSQVFFPLWARPGAVGDRLAGRGTSWTPRREFRVVVCKDRSEYLSALGVSEANIGVSVGYYNSESRMSFFYPGPQLDVTLFHELTHQLMAEASQLRGATPGKFARDFWLVEGIALYMESLVDGIDHWRVGGWMAPRCQSARYRALHDGYWVAWDKFTAGGMEQWKADPEIGKLYTQAAGLVHFFLDPRLPSDAEAADAQPESASGTRQMDFDGEAARVALFNTLIAVYSGEQPDGRLLELIGGPDAQRSYVNFLLVRDSHLFEATAAAADVSSTLELVLTRSQLSPAAWQRLGQFQNLEWLDVSFSNATSQDLKWLGQLDALERLSLEGTSIDGSCLSAVAQLPKLKELDLSQCALDDGDLARLRGAAALETLWLSGTRITASSAAVIESLPRLSFVALDHTQIPADEAKRLSERIQARSRKNGQQ